MALRALSLFSLLLASTGIHAASGSDIEVVRKLILNSPADCIAGRPTAALAHLDKDFVLTFPNSPPQDYAGMVRDYGNMCKLSPGGLERSDAEFDELTVGRDFAVARLKWATHLRGAPSDTIRWVGEMQIWRKTPGGWRWWRSARWPIKAPSQ